MFIIIYILYIHVCELMQFGVFTCRPMYLRVVFGECVRLFVHTVYIYFNGQR